MITKPALATPPATIIRPVRPFDPKIFGARWSIWRGPPEGDGLKGEEDCDPRSLALAELDLSQVVLDDRLRKGEDWIGCEEWDKRLLSEKADYIRLDPAGAVACRDDPSKYPEAWKRTPQGETIYVFWDGQKLRSPSGDRNVVYSYWNDGTVELGCTWLDDRRYASDPSALLASKPSGPPA